MEKTNGINYFSLNDLDSIYSDNLTQNTNRINTFISSFKNLYSIPPKFIARAPGRINLIGEHIDYEGYPVLPMAIDNDILIAVGFIKKDDPFDTSSLIINHLDSSSFANYTFNLIPDKFSKPYHLTHPHSWINYVLSGFNCAAHLIHKLSHKHQEDFNFSAMVNSDMVVLVTGNIPFGSGLSSSSALSVCSVLAYLNCYLPNKLNSVIDKELLAQETINYERLVGTACGGMDQTISIFGEKNSAKLIRFYPVNSVENVSLVKNVSFLVANSLTESLKIDTLAHCYNKRVVENRIGVNILEKSLKGEEKYEIEGEFKVFKMLNEFQNFHNFSFNDLESLINENFTKDEYTLEEIRNLLLSTNLEEILKDIPHFQTVLEKNSTFKLKQRLTHVINEARRVNEFYLEASKKDEEINVQKLGQLMNESHNSCDSLYECSSNELNELVEFARDNGALGARLTGAGWGGCMISLFENEKVDDFLGKLEKFYEKKEKKNENVLAYFKVSPSNGACIINNESN